MSLSCTVVRVKEIQKKTIVFDCHDHVIVALILWFYGVFLGKKTIQKQNMHVSVIEWLCFFVLFAVNLVFRDFCFKQLFIAQGFCYSLLFSQCSFFTQQFLVQGSIRYWPYCNRTGSTLPFHSSSVFTLPVRMECTPNFCSTIPPRYVIRFSQFLYGLSQSLTTYSLRGDPRDGLNQRVTSHS